MKLLITILLLLISLNFYGQVTSLDEFENTEGWSFNQSDGVNVSLANEPGITGNAIRFDYNFTKGTGYGGIQKWFPIDLPENFEFTFYLKADSPANNFEIKFIDSTGNNVWWVNNRNYDFPQEWKKIKIKKRHIQFAWGPTSDQSLKRIDRIEFTVASYLGGKGTIWLDELRFEPLSPETSFFLPPLIEATSAIRQHPPDYMLDYNDQSYWQTKGKKDQQVMIDFRKKREFGGLHISWRKGYFARSIDVMVSENGNEWERAWSVDANTTEETFIRMPEAEARFVKLILDDSFSGEGFGISEINILDISESMTMNDFLIYAARHSPPGSYPRYFLEQASYWTVTGVNNDVKEALINEDGMVEVEKGRFSLEPMIKIGDSVYNWSNVVSTQALGDADEFGGFNFMPSVTWKCGGIEVTTEVASHGIANVSSLLDIRYHFENLSDRPLDFEFFVLIRPFQVNPYYQWLNLTGGAGKINSIREDDSYPGKVIAVDDKYVVSHQSYDDFGAFRLDEGDMLEMLNQGKMPGSRLAEDEKGMAGGVIRYAIHLEPSGEDACMVTVPYYGKEGMDEVFKRSAYKGFDETLRFWKEKTGHIRFRLPASADGIIKAYEANLIYILINRDNAGIQPGSRSYERSWIRDGALTSSALLKSGIVAEVRDFIEWYAAHIYENGKVPCVVDSRGPDPVPENDSHGEFIYLIREYFNFTQDTAFLRSQNENILKVVSYIESLIAERSTYHYKFGNDSVRAHYGLVPESISHEGYSAKPMHSYWDNFFTMKGLKDATDIQRILGEDKNYIHISQVRDTFRENLYHSLRLAMQYKGIDYIPGCVELGDFDATSTTIALTPCNELNNLPRPEIYNTFDKYYAFFEERRDGKREWINYTPYENRLIGSFIILDQPDRAHELIRFFLDDQRPQGWHHWAEVVWNNERKPGFIGDMPHTWCGSDFINAIRSMFVYENEYDHSLVLASALYQDWIDAPEGMSVENLPTYYGEISYSIKKENEKYVFKIYGDLELPSNGIKIRNFNGSKLPGKVTVNGKEMKDYNEKEISVKEFPAELTIYY